MFGGEDAYGTGLFAQLAGFGGSTPRRMNRPDPRVYSDYFKAYSMAMLPGKERENVSYGGKVIMPPSALARLTQLDLESPWMFKLSNTVNLAAFTHAGVLEFIAEEGCVHLPQWMMQTCRLNEGDPIRITGVELPKGKFTKLQPQSTHFLEIADPKAVLEQSLRHFSCLTQGDIVEISYNSIVFGLLIMETQPGGEGISVLDTDLEVDFAPPVGYVEPERPKPVTTTMRERYNIDVDASTPGSSRPGSAIGGSFPVALPGKAVSKGGDHWESFKGKGETLTGRKTKGKGISSRPAEQVADGTKIIRTDKRLVVTSESLELEVNAPASLNLPPGKLFFGYKYIPYTAPDAVNESVAPKPQAFTGSGNKLTGSSKLSTSSNKGKEPEKPVVGWGSGGHTLGSSAPQSQGAGGASVPIPRSAMNSRREQSRSPTPDYGVSDDDDEYIDIDSD